MASLHKHYYGETSTCHNINSKNHRLFMEDFLAGPGKAHHSRRPSPPCHSPPPHPIPVTGLLPCCVPEERALGYFDRSQTQNSVSYIIAG